MGQEPAPLTAKQQTALAAVCDLIRLAASDAKQREVLMGVLESLADATAERQTHPCRDCGAPSDLTGEAEGNLCLPCWQARDHNAPRAKRRREATAAKRAAELAQIEVMRRRGAQ